MIRGDANKPIPNPGRVYMISAANSDQIVEAQGLARTGKDGEWVILTSAGMPGTTPPTFGSSVNCYEE